MTKTLTLFRHGKSSWDNPFDSDYERELNNRGKKHTPIMGKHLQLFVKPQLILVSGAKRTRQTAKLVLETFEHKFETDNLDALYHASPSDILKEIGKSSDQHEHLMVIGHNPGLTDLINQISNIRLDNLPTASFAVLVWETKNTWKEISSGKIKGELFTLQLAREVCE